MVSLPVLSATEEKPASLSAASFSGPEQAVNPNTLTDRSKTIILFMFIADFPSFKSFTS